MRDAARVIMAMLAFVVVSIAFTTSAQATTTYWQANYDTCDLSEWTADGYGTNPLNTGAGDSFTVTSPTFNNSACALDMHIDDTAGASATRLLRKANPDGSPLPTTAVYGSRYRFNTVPVITTHMGIAQFKSNYFATTAACTSGTVSSDPLWSVNVENNGTGLSLRLDQHIGDTGGYAGFVRSYTSTPILVKNHWYKVEVAYTWSATGAGSVTVLLDGVSVITVSPVYSEILGVTCPAHQADIHRYWGVDAYSGGSLSPATWDLYTDSSKVWS